ncbi:helix-turn-helix transcriptional regulator [Streptomyces sp. NPDC051639]|uniref:helix-turn-helix domain-containing protein n=1 Tax=Streptomyces sp. NPDC051639 TaxID=3155671 RepID=UPI00343266A1
MCRPEKPITTSNSALRDLQEWLREQRARTGQGYRTLSVRAGCHATTLQRAASGTSVPKLQTVLHYARACDASPDEARHLWKRARCEESRLARRGRGQPAPRKELIRDFADLGAALVDLYEVAGSPTLRTMEQRAGGFGALPRSTAHRIVNRQTIPHNLPQFQAYLRACEVPEVDWPHWEAAWTRAWRHEKQDDFLSLGSLGITEVEVRSPLFDTPETIRRQTAALMEKARLTEDLERQTARFLALQRKDLQKEYDEIMERRSDPPKPLRRVAEVRVQRDPARRLRGQRGRARASLEASVLGQLAFPVVESTPKTDVLF